MKATYLIAEIGSTTTVVTAFGPTDEKNFARIAQGQAPTSVADGDVTIGLQAALQEAEQSSSAPLEWEQMIASSSAAGGLRMTVHGLVYDMTVRAAREAALGAGANIHLITAGLLSDDDLFELEQIRPNILLLAGGVDYGESGIILANAKKITELSFRLPVVFAGNQAIKGQILRIFQEANFPIRIVENVYPRIDQLNVEPTRKAIQDVFEEHIVEAPGMSKIREMVTGKITPTPGAVLLGAQLLQKAIGDLVVIDVGGATTDVHSVTAGDPEIAAMLIAPEPLAKRTVEGDLGVYINGEKVLSLCDAELIARELNYPQERLQELIVPIPKSELEKNFVTLLTEKATWTGMIRHAGVLEYLYGPTGRMTVSRGKDLTAIRWIIGTGGALTQLPNGRSILSKLNQPRSSQVLLPRHGQVLLDKDYILAAAGLLAEVNPEGALALLGTSLFKSIVLFNKARDSHKKESCEN